MRPVETPLSQRPIRWITFCAAQRRNQGKVCHLTGRQQFFSRPAPLATEMGADAVHIGKTIHPHPTLGESIGLAADVANGSCKDLPPARK
jgi:hypothetical protein